MAAPLAAASATSSPSLNTRQQELTRLAKMKTNPFVGAENQSQSTAVSSQRNLAIYASLAQIPTKIAWNLSRGARAMPRAAKS